MPYIKRYESRGNNVKFATPRDFTLSEQSKAWLRKGDRLRKIGRVLKGVIVLMTVGHLIWAGYLIAKIHYIGEHLVTM